MIFALRSGGYLILLLVFWFGLGRALRRWLTDRETGAAQSTLQGFALATLAATLGYHLGAPLGWIFRGLAAVAITGWIIEWREVRQARRAPPADAWLWLIGGGLLLTPLAAGGLQFALFHGNHYDALNYLQSAVTRLAYSQREISAAGPAAYLQNPLLVIASYLGTARPAIVDSYALTDGLAPGNLYQLGPAFLAGLLLLAIPAMADLARRLGATPRMGGWIGLASVTGFWGQYVLDCDAWSLIGALPLSLLVFGELAALLDPGSGRAPPALALAVPAAALLLVYPEQGCFLAPAAAALIVAGWRRARRPGVGRTLGRVGLVTAILVAPCAADLWTFIAGQIHAARHTDRSMLDWVWTVFFGPAPQAAPLWSTGLRALTGSLGLSAPWTGSVGLILGGTLGVAVVIAAGWTARRMLRPPAWRGATQQLLLVVAILLAQTAVLGLLAGSWPAAKALTYSFPWILLLAFLPLTAAVGGRSRRWPAALLLGLQLCWAGGRIAVAAELHGSGYPPPYPAAEPALKINRRWDVNESPQVLAAAHRVRIDVPDLWLEYYAMICVQARGVAFTKATPVRKYYDMTPETYGRQAAAPEADGLVFVEYDRQAGAMGLGFSAGHDVRWSGVRPATISRIDGPARLESWDGLLAWWNSATLTIDANQSGAFSLEWVLRFSPDLSDTTRPIVGIAVNGQPVRILTFRPSADGIRPGIALPLQLKAGRNTVTITTSVPGVGFGNPRVLPSGPAP